MKPVDGWKCGLDQSIITGVVPMDLSKAFDCLPHTILIAKLHAYGVDWSACELLVDYLGNRLQRLSSTIQNVLLTAELLLIGLIRTEWKRILMNSNLWYCPITRLIKLKWNWIRIPFSNLKSQARLWESLSDHISTCCPKATWLLNVLATISKCLDSKFYQKKLRVLPNCMPLLWKDQ